MLIMLDVITSYSIHYTKLYDHYWQSELACEAFPYGQFGENLTVEGLTEKDVRIGDIVRNNFV